MTENQTFIQNVHLWLVGPLYCLSTASSYTKYTASLRLHPSHLGVCSRFAPNFPVFDCKERGICLRAWLSFLNASRSREHLLMPKLLFKKTNTHCWKTPVYFEYWALKHEICVCKNTWPRIFKVMVQFCDHYPVRLSCFLENSVVVLIDH